MTLEEGDTQPEERDKRERKRERIKRKKKRENKKREIRVEKLLLDEEGKPRIKTKNVPDLY